jgi:hypothetical protein
MGNLPYHVSSPAIIHHNYALLFHSFIIFLLKPALQQLLKEHNKSSFGLSAYSAGRTANLYIATPPSFGS